MSKVDVILTGGAVATMNADFDLFDPGAVAIRAGNIEAVGPAERIAAAYSADEVVDCAGCAIVPGLINTHTHAPMTLLRGLADDLRLDVWLMGYMMPVEHEFVRPDFCWLGTQLACAEMIHSGTTCFADMYYYEEAVADATAQAGLRAVCAETVLQFPSPDALSYDEGLEHARDFILRWKGHPLIMPAVGPHAPYTTTADLLRACGELAREFDVPLHIHIAETAQEAENHRAEHGMPIVPWVKKLGVFEAKVTAAHCVHIDEGEMRTLLHHGVGVAHNPTSNLKLASGFAPVVRMLELGLDVGIGTDGPASNNDLDMWEELRLAALLAKCVTSDPTALPARQALAMATIGGARALHIADAVGSLEAGKRADVAVVDMRSPHNTPRFTRDPDALYAQLVYATKGSDVRDVMCQGQWLMRERRLLTLDEQSLMAEAAAIARKIDTFLIQREESVLSKLLVIGQVAQKKTFEIQVKVRLADGASIEGLLDSSEIVILKPSRRRQYDTYFLFDDPWHNRLRYREDELLDQNGEVQDVVCRLTMTSEGKDREYAKSVLLSRSRFDAPATRSLRFYREYFKPEAEVEVHKERRRYRVRYGGTDFAINLDRLIKPDLPGLFLEIKSRTWSKQDAERKAEMIGELLELFQVQEQELVKPEYVKLAIKA
ncbi:MAG: amidohydrolase [Chloroflexi bacterium]|nr:MAG: amidohydrolase [Anaerolineaceae bacterium 4572_32.2]RLC76562.1 MAG: amidohydrolase [Chloroflexota bacterium]RLC83430.1 MAG: amidohydrolase [Chloroflexota bacterium]